MILTKLRLNNFKRFRDLTELNLEVTSINKNIILIEALNGVWKTSILQAIQWAFFWLENSEFKKHLNYESIEDRDYSIYIEIEYKDNDFNICNIKRKYEAVSADSVPKETIIFSVGWKIQNLSPEEWNDYLNKTFPKEISNFFFFDWEKIQYLINPNDPKKVKSAIEKVLWIETIRNLRENLSDLRSDAFKIVNNEGADKKIQIKSIHLEDYQNKKNILKWDLANLETQFGIQDANKNEILSNIELLAKSGLTKEKIEERKNTQQLIDWINNELAIIENSIEIFKNDFIDIFLLAPYFDILDDKIKLESLIKSDIATSKIDDEKVNKIIQALFLPKCIIWWENYDFNKNEIVKQKIINALSNEDSNSSKEIILDLNNKEVLDLSLAINNAKKCDSLKLDEIIDRKLHLLDTVSLHKRIILDIDRQISSIDESPLDIDELYSNLNDIGILLQKTNLDLSIKNKELDFLEIEIRKLQKELEIILSQSSSLDENRKYLELLSSLVSLFDDYIWQLITTRKWELEKKTFEMFQNLSNQNIYKRVDITEDYEVKLVDSTWSYQTNLSSWYNQILMTSLLWWLEQLSDFQLPLIIDTPLARLDPLHRKNMLEKYFARAGWQVIILSQPSEITESDKKNPLFSNNLKNNEFISIEFNEKKMQSVITYKSIT